MARIYRWVQVVGSRLMLCCCTSDRDGGSVSDFHASLSLRDADNSRIMQFETSLTDVFKGVDDIKPNVQPPPRKPQRSGKSRGMTSGSDVRIQLSDPGSIPSFQFYVVSWSACTSSSSHHHRQFYFRQLGP